jgi:hypothetical protein
MKARAVRLPDPLVQGVEMIQRREGLDASTATRKLLKMGLERYVAQLYREGEVTLREAAELLELPLREAMDRFSALGVPGNITIDQSLRAMDLSRRLADREPR